MTAPVLLTAACGDSSDSTADAGDAANSPAETPSSSSKTPCPPVEGSGERQEVFDGPPEFCIDPQTTAYTATFVTSEGNFTAELDAVAAPETVNNFVVLSRYHYYDGTPIHRVVPGFVIQGGDGDGAPYGSNDLGYAIDDELPESSAAYTDYSLAMANAGPDTNGSQFFVVLPGGGGGLQPLYSWFGQVTEGQSVVDTIAALGQPATDGPPTSDVTVETVEITEAPL
ncbi:MAG: peptidylprolyl isomerase [Actinomycetia bacterium]|nr:peptidylprolyl isomerase [Actinomycetes bacterium]